MRPKKFFVIMALFLGITQLFFVNGALGQDYEFLFKWGSEGSGDGQFILPYSIATDASGNVYVADSYNHRIQKFTSDGVLITKWGTYGSEDGQLKYPYGLTVDASGNVFVADTGNNRIQKFSGEGVFTSKWGSEGSEDGLFYFPWSVATDASGDVYVADSYNHRIQKFTSDGVFTAKWGSYGSEDGQFKYPCGLAVDASGNVFVADNWNNRIQKFTSSGVFASKWGSFGSGAGQLKYPYGLTVDASGNVFVADTGNSRIQKFSGEGVFTSKWGSFGSEDGQFNEPLGVAVSVSGDVYVADTENDRIEVFGISASTTSTLYGWVRDDYYGSPVSLAVVTAVNGVGDTLSATTDYYGYYELPGLYEGEWTVSMYDQRYPTQSKDVYVSGGYYPVDFVIEPAGVISGYVTQRLLGQPISGALIMVFHESGEAKVNFTGSDGYYELPVFHDGLWTITAKEQFYHSATVQIPVSAGSEDDYQVNFQLLRKLYP